MNFKKNKSKNRGNNDVSSEYVSIYRLYGNGYICDDNYIRDNAKVYGKAFVPKIDSEIK